MCCIPVAAGPEALAFLGPFALALLAALAVAYALTHYFAALLTAGLLAVASLLALAVHWARRDARNGFDLAAHNARAARLTAPEPVHRPRARKTASRCVHAAPGAAQVHPTDDPDWAVSTRESEPVSRV